MHKRLLKLLKLLLRLHRKPLMGFTSAHKPLTQVLT